MLVYLLKHTHRPHLNCDWFISYISGYAKNTEIHPYTLMHTYKHHTQLVYNTVMINDIVSYNNAELKSWFLTQTTLSEHCKGTNTVHILKSKYVLILYERTDICYIRYKFNTTSHSHMSNRIPLT